MTRQASKRVLCALLAPLLLCGCTQKGTEAEVQVQPTPRPTQAESASQDSVEQLLQKMTLREKVGQLFIVRPDALDPTLSQQQIDDEDGEGVTHLSDVMRQTLQTYPVGGICQFGKNITDPAQITQFNADLQAASKIPLLIAVDEEGGAVARLANHPGFTLPQYDSAAAVGATGDPEAARQMGRTIGAYLREYGFTMDFAPVADVYTNSANTVIGTRAFSQEAATVAAMAGAMAQGLQEEGILPTLKHFPGHGDTAEDSHSGLAYTQRTREEMMDCEFLPFLLPTEGSDGIGPHAIMVGHIAAPALSSEEEPASLSYGVVTELLREDLLPEEDVLVITDSLSMGAITKTYTPEEAAVLALQAGCDLLLMPQGLEAAFEAVWEAVQSGQISEQRLDDSVARILRYKQQYAGL